jgi:glutamate/tyrosine decarboxylase-like PLP-dependent enzyme
MNLPEKITELEKSAIHLEPDVEKRKEIRNWMVNYTEDFLNSIRDLKTYEIEDAGWKNDPFQESGINDFKELDPYLRSVDNSGINPASGGHLGYIPGGGLYTSSIGDYWAAITNRYSGILFANPNAVRMENQLIRWMAQLAGYPKGCAGNLASGGSIANLSAIVTARKASKVKAADFPKLVIYLSPQTHHCVDKAIVIAGLEESVLRRLPLNSLHQIDADKFEVLVEKDIADGLKPFLLVASAGTTDTGAIDPLSRLGDICETNNIWFHVDAAYGGFFLMCDSVKLKFRGIEKSDSLVMDPHKGLFLPYGLGVVLVKDGQMMKEAFKYFANYMQDAHVVSEDVSPADVSPELTKHFRGPRLWLPLKIHGLKAFRDCLEEKILLTNYFYQELQKINGFEVGPEPELSVCIYRYRPSSGDINEFNRSLVKEMHKDGRVFISSTTINGEVFLRLAVLSFRTHLREIDLALSTLKEKIRILESK